MTDDSPTLEGALARTEADAESAVATVKRLQRAANAALKAARTGDLTALRRAMGDAEDAVGESLDRVTALQDGWAFADEEAEEAHFASGAYRQELIEAAREAGVGLYEQGDALAAYPSLLRVQPRSRAVTIDRKAIRTVRPSYLARQLLAAQRREPKVRAAAFLETLLRAYRLLARTAGDMVKLIDVYQALTMLPTARADYGQQEFARDLYLLDASGMSEARDGSRMRLTPGATGSKNPAGLLVVVTREGVERTYYGLEFARRQ
jgi:hypothetical protein